MQLEGKRIIVTGGARGIGEATVLAYAREGARVVSLDILDDLGTKVAEEATNKGPGAVSYLHCDITTRANVDAAFDQALSELGGLDVLTMIAGNEQDIPLGDLTDDLIDQGMVVHVKGTILTNQAALRVMKDTGGSIINYSSFAGVDGMQGMPIYSAAKGAVLGLSRSLAKDWGRYNIRINSVCPAVLTPLAQEWLEGMDAERRAEIDAWYQSQIPLGGKLGSPEDAAELNVFLASDRARHITGQTIGVDGGMMFSR